MEEVTNASEVIDFFEQNELKLYDFFENIYHKNYTLSSMNTSLYGDITLEC